jgi:dTDP-4-dehydrorhamnose reductase
MRILVFGGSGMLGHKLVAYLRQKGYETWATFRGERDGAGKYDIYECDPVRRESDIGLAFAISRPDVVINCIGVVKQKIDEVPVHVAVETNAVFPNKLAAWCVAASAQLIHVSTDCVFSGKGGAPYSVFDSPDATDLYGRTKALGEISGALGVFTLRTSIIGLEEKQGGKSLIEWFLSRVRAGDKEIPGYTNVVFNGLTTHVFSQAIERIVEEYADGGVWTTGLFHVGALQSISKGNLLNALAAELEAGVTVKRTQADVPCDRTLDATLFVGEFNWSRPSWDTMISSLAEEIRVRGDLDE